MNTRERKQVEAIVQDELDEILSKDLFSTRGTDQPGDNDMQRFAGLLVYNLPYIIRELLYDDTRGNKKLTIAFLTSVIKTQKLDIDLNNREKHRVVDLVYDVVDSEITTQLEKAFGSIRAGTIHRKLATKLKD